MRMDFVVVFDPSVDEPERCFGVRNLGYTDIVRLRVLTKASDIPFDWGLATGVKQGVRFSACANSLVSRAV